MTLWMAFSYGYYDGMLIYDAIVGIGMCIIIWGIMKGKSIAFVLFICLELVNGCVRTGVDRNGVHILVSFLLCGIMALLLLLKNKEGKNGYDIMFNKERTEQEKALIVSKASMPKEVATNQDNSKLKTDKPQGYSDTGSVNVNEIKDIPLCCDNCGKSIDTDALYCNHCGKKLK